MNEIRFYISEHLEFVVITQGILRFDEHCHTKNLVISAILSGTAKLTLNKKERTLSKGEVFSLLPYENHSIKSSAPVDMVSMCISKELLSVDEDRLSALFTSAVNGLWSEEKLACDDIKQLLISTALTVCSAARDIVCEQDELLTCDRSRLETVPETEEDIESLAENSYMSKYHYIRRFKSIAGLTPNRFRVQNRIRKAQQMLRNGKDLTETALDMGFYDQSHFNKYFKRIVGIAPGDYIRSLRNFLQE